jgi:enoyl-CoA hydratase/carnithine racemase
VGEHVSVAVTERVARVTLERPEAFNALDLGLARCMAQPDGAEGLRAFVEKRPPRYDR